MVLTAQVPIQFTGISEVIARMKAGGQLAEAVMKFMIAWNGQAELGTLEELEADIAQLLGITKYSDIDQFQWAHAYNEMVANHPEVVPNPGDRIKNMPIDVEGCEMEQTDGVRHHPLAQCTGGHCPFHSPSDHPLKDATVRLGQSGLVFRVCKHGHNHPDPDSVVFYERTRGTNFTGLDHPKHCDGCC